MNEIIKYSIKSIYRKKMNVISCLTIGLLISMTILISTYYKSMNNFIENDLKNDFYYNTLLVHQKYNLEEEKKDLKIIRGELEKLDGVIGVFSTTSRYNGITMKNLKNKEISGNTELYAANNETLPKIVKGTNFPDLKNNYIICPENFYPNDMDYSNLTKDKFINLKPFLNKKITFEYQNFDTNKKLDIEYKLIGLYENSSTVMDEGICFVTEKSLFDIYVKQRKGLKDFKLEDQRGFFVQVEDINKLDNVTKNLENIGYSVRPTTYIDYSIFEQSFEKVNKIAIILYFFIFILLLLITFKLFKDNKHNYNTLYKIGHKKRTIQKINFITNLIFIFMSQIISIIFSILINIILKIIIDYKPLIFNKRTLLMDYHTLPFIFVMTILTTIIVSIICNMKILEENK